MITVCTSKPVWQCWSCTTCRIYNSKVRFSLLHYIYCTWSVKCRLSQGILALHCLSYCFLCHLYYLNLRELHTYHCTRHFDGYYFLCDSIIWLWPFYFKFQQWLHSRYAQLEYTWLPSFSKIYVTFQAQNRVHRVQPLLNIAKNILAQRSFTYFFQSFHLHLTVFIIGCSSTFYKSNFCFQGQKWTFTLNKLSLQRHRDKL